jgi:hypothetical protein
MIKNSKSYLSNFHKRRDLKKKKKNSIVFGIVQFLDFSAMFLTT